MKFRIMANDTSSRLVPENLLQYGETEFVCPFRTTPAFVSILWVGAVFQLLMVATLAQLRLEDTVAPRPPQKQMALPADVPVKLGTWEAAGTQWLLQQEPAEAFRAFRMAKRVDSRSAFAWWGLGYSQRSEKVFSQPAFAEAKRLNPGVPFFAAWAGVEQQKTELSEFSKLAEDEFLPSKLTALALPDAQKLAADFPQPGVWEWLAKQDQWQAAERLFLLEGAYRMRWQLVAKDAQRLAGEMPAFHRLRKALQPLWTDIPEADQMIRQKAIEQTEADLPEAFARSWLAAKGITKGSSKRELDLAKAELPGCPKLADCGPLGWMPPVLGPKAVQLIRDNAGELEPGLPLPWTLINVYLDESCPRCLNQMALLADDLPHFEPIHTQVLCIGGDSVAKISSNSRFPFLLLGDAGRKTAQELGCHDPYTELPLHGTFVCDERNHLRWWYTGELPFENFKILRAEISRLQTQQPHPHP